ncbi:hypothetical protein COL154_013710 [Colletotrichum chrysophilum]|nr:hypothetical protein COL154_013710 [Colletotrichum chrysophilum]
MAHIVFCISQPAQDFVSMPVQLTHPSNLMTTLFNVALIDADSIDPENAIFLGSSQVLKGVKKIVRDEERFPVDFDHIA